MKGFIYVPNPRDPSAIKPILEIKREKITLKEAVKSIPYFPLRSFTYKGMFILCGSIK